MNKIKHDKFDMFFLLTQIVLLIMGYLFGFFFYNEGRTEWLAVEFGLETFFLQFFFVQYVSILLGAITYIKGSLKVMVFFDSAAVLIGMIVMICSYILCIFFGAEGYHGGSSFTHYSTYYVEAVSWILLVVKAVIDGKRLNRNLKEDRAKGDNNASSEK